MKNWSNYEILFIKTHYKKISIKLISKILKRSIPSVTWKIRHIFQHDNILEYKKQLYRKNKNKICKQNLESKIRNIERHRITRRKYEKNRKEKDINFRLRKLLRKRLHSAIKKNCKKGSAVSDLGCSIEKFKLWLEMHFQEGMNWDNQNKWHIDHKIPLAIFDLTQREQFLRAFHFTNLQPLWAEDNLRKSDKII